MRLISAEKDTVNENGNAFTRRRWKRRIGTVRRNPPIGHFIWDYRLLNGYNNLPELFKYGSTRRWVAVVVVLCSFNPEKLTYFLGSKSNKI